MAFSPKTIRIIAASFLAVVLVAGAYSISGPTPFFKFANAQSTDTLLKAYAAKDSDNDGLPDWQEVLYNTDPNNAHSISPTLTDSEAVAKGLVTPHTSATVPGAQASTTKVTAADIPGPDPAPGSLTDQFGQEFFQAYVSASQGQQLTPDQQNALVQQLMTSYGQKAAGILISSYTSISLHTSPGTSITNYAGTVENIIRAHDVPAASSQPLVLIQAYVQNNDASALPKLAVLSAAYAGIAKDLLATPVPPALANQHLALIQSFDTIARATKAAANYGNDPLLVMGSLSVLPASSQTIVDTFTSLAQAILANGEPAAGTPGALIVNIARSTQQSS